MIEKYENFNPDGWVERLKGVPTRFLEEEIKRREIEYY